MSTSRTGIRWLFRMYKIFTLSKDYSWESGYRFSKSYEFRDVKKHKKLRMIIEENGNITIKKGYTWDGCTPKFSFLDLLVIGIPDGILSDKTGKRKAYYASLVHDALYQFLPDLPADQKIYTRKMADDIFLQILTDAEFAPRKIYWWAVRIFGGVTMKTRKFIRQTEGSVNVMKRTPRSVKKGK